MSRSPGSRDRHAGRKGTPYVTGNPNFTHESAVVPPRLKPGQHRCPVCRNAVGVTPVTGVLRKHLDLFGHDCWNKALSVGVPRDAQPVEVEAPVTVRDGNTLRPKGRCYECDRPVSGERKFCGACLALH